MTRFDSNNCVYMYQCLKMAWEKPKRENIKTGQVVMALLLFHLRML